MVLKGVTDTQTEKWMDKWTTLMLKSRITTENVDIKYATVTYKNIKLTFKSRCFKFLKTDSF